MPRLCFVLKPDKGSDLPAVELPEREAMVLLTMAANGECAAMALAEVVWPDADDMPDGWYDLLHLYLSRLRKYLKPHGWRIANRYDRGWRLEKLEVKA